MTRAPRKPRILLVEDDEDLLQMIVRILASVGEIRTARDGELAWDTLSKDEPPDLVVTDLMMPRKDGLQLLSEMKKDPRLASVPAIVLTAKTGSRDVIAGINAGARHYVTKPFKPDELLGKVRHALKRPRR